MLSPTTGLAVSGPPAFFDFLLGFPIWLIACGFVIATKQRRGTLGPFLGVRRCQLNPWAARDDVAGEA